MTSTTPQLLHKLFNDPKTGFTGADKLLRRKNHLKISSALLQKGDFVRPLKKRGKNLRARFI